MQSQEDTVINNLTREEIVDILQNKGGYQCYDHESIADLRETLRTDIARGILPKSILPA